MWIKSKVEFGSYVYSFILSILLILQKIIFPFWWYADALFYIGLLLIILVIVSFIKYFLDYSNLKIVNKTASEYLSKGNSRIISFGNFSFFKGFSRLNLSWSCYDFPDFSFHNKLMPAFKKMNIDKLDGSSFLSAVCFFYFDDIGKPMEIALFTKNKHLYDKFFFTSIKIPEIKKDVSVKIIFKDYKLVKDEKFIDVKSIVLGHLDHLATARDN